MINEKVSIIIPMYNATDTIELTLSSIITQSWENIEVIVINDGSTDNCDMKVQKISMQDSRVFLINNDKNLGVGLTRNRGLDIAHGDYILFIDADDEIEKNYIKTLLLSARQEDADITESGAKVVLNDRESIYPYGKDDSELVICGTLDYIKRYLTFYANVSVWGKLYRKEVIGSLRFIDGNINEDFIFLWSVVQRTHKYVRNNRVHYIYHLDHINSLSKSLFSSEHMNIIEHIHEVRQVIQLQYPTLIKEAKNYCDAMLLHTMILYKKSLRTFSVEKPYFKEGIILISEAETMGEIQRFLLLHEALTDKEQVVNEIKEYLERLKI